MWQVHNFSYRRFAIVVVVYFLAHCASIDCDRVLHRSQYSDSEESLSFVADGDIYTANDIISSTVNSIKNPSKSVLEFTGGTNEPRVPISHQFENLYNYTSAILTVSVGVGDYDGDEENVFSILANGMELLSMPCRPGAECTDELYVCVAEVNVTELIKHNYLNLTAEASDQVFGHCLYQDLYSFYIKYELVLTVNTDDDLFTLTDVPTSVPTTEDGDFIPFTASILVEGGSDDPLLGYGHTFTKLKGVTQAYLWLDIGAGDYGEEDEYVESIAINDINLLGDEKTCKPYDECTDTYFPCLSRHNITRFLNDKKEVRVVVKATQSVYSFCKFKGRNYLYVRLLLVLYCSSKEACDALAPDKDDEFGSTLIVITVVSSLLSILMVALVVSVCFKRKKDHELARIRIAVEVNPYVSAIATAAVASPPGANRSTINRFIESLRGLAKLERERTFPETEMAEVISIADLDGVEYGFSEEVCTTAAVAHVVD